MPEKEPVYTKMRGFKLPEERLGEVRALLQQLSGLPQRAELIDAILGHALFIAECRAEEIIHCRNVMEFDEQR